jgi:hypothetical protein
MASVGVKTERKKDSSVYLGMGLIVFFSHERSLLWRDGWLSCGVWVTYLVGAWASKMVAHLLGSLGSNLYITKKIINGRHKQRSGRQTHSSPPEKYTKVFSKNFSLNTAWNVKFHVFVDLYCAYAIQHVLYTRLCTVSPNRGNEGNKVIGKR